VSIWNIKEEKIEHCIQKWGQRDAKLGHTSGMHIWMVHCSIANHTLLRKERLKTRPLF